MVSRLFNNIVPSFAVPDNMQWEPSTIDGGGGGVGQIYIPPKKLVWQEYGRKHYDGNTRLSDI